MLTIEQAKAKLLSLLREKSVFHGDFVLSSGARSSYYVDCKLTTLDPEGAWLVGQVMHWLIESEAEKRGVRILHLRIVQTVSGLFRDRPDGRLESGTKGFVRSLYRSGCANQSKAAQ